MTPKEAFYKVLERAEFAYIGHGDVDMVIKALNKLERLKKFKETFDNYELAKKQGFIAYENWLECEKELEELKRDVKKALEERDMYFKALCDIESGENVRKVLERTLT